MHKRSYIYNVDMTDHITNTLYISTEQKWKISLRAHSQEIACS